MKYSTKTILAYALAIFAAGFAFFVFYAQASFNEQINYQGKLANSSGVAVPDGTYCMKFRIMDALTDGNELWSEIWTAANAKVSTTSGLFSILLGSHTAFTNIFNSASLYLEVQLDAACDATYEEIFTPRKQMGTVPAAFEAKQLAGGTWAVPGTIGSTTPNTGAFTTLTSSGTATLGDATSDIHGMNTAAVANQMLTASYANSTADVVSYFIKGTQTSSGDTSGGKETYGYYLTQNISGTDTSVIVPTSSYGVYLDINDTSVVNNAAALHYSYGIYSDVSFGGTNTANSALLNYAGYFTSTGNMGTTGGTEHYGLYSIVSGTADTNYGLWVSALGATTNYGIWVDAGNVVLDNDSQLLYFGEAQDASIQYEGTGSATKPLGLIINSQVVGTGAVYVGNDTTNAAPAAGVISATGGLGTNIAGASLTVRGGAGTGTGAVGDLAFQTSTLGTTGTTLQTYSTRWTINGVGSLLSGTDGTSAYAITTTGAIGAGAITGTSFVIGANTLTTSEWAFLDGQNQAVATTSSPTFANITDSGLTITRVPYASTAGLLVDSANMTFNGTTLTAGGFSTTGTTATGALTATGTATLGDATSDIHGMNTAAVANQMLTASYANSTADVVSYFLKGTQTSSGDNSGSKETYGYYLTQNISGTDTNPILSNSYGVYLDVNDTSVLNSVTAPHYSYGIYSDVSFGGTNTANLVLANYAGYFTSTGNMGTTGSTEHYGLYSTVTGTADTNYGLWVSSSGATTNYGIWVDAGNVVLDNDSQLLYFGEAQDASITFDGNSLNIVANAVTATDDLEMTADVIQMTATTGVGIGTSAPAKLLDVKGSNPVVRLTDNRNLATTGWAGTEIAALEFYTTDPSGSGTKVTGAVKSVGNSTSSGGTLTGDLVFYSNPSGTTLTEKMRLKGTDEIVIGAGAAGVDYFLTINGETNDGSLTWMEDEDYFLFSDNIALGAAADANTFSTATHGAGSTTMYIGNSTINVTAPSDIATKENIVVDTEHGIDDLMKLTVKKFKYKKEYVDEGEEQEEHTGLIAQEVAEIFPEAIIYRSDDLIAVDYTKLMPYIIKSMQDLKNQMSGVKISSTGAAGTGSVEGVETTAFVKNVKDALVSLGFYVKDGVATIEQVIAQKITARTARIEKIEMVDSKTGDIYCTWVQDGEWQKVKGECASAVAAIAPAVPAVPEQTSPAQTSGNQPAEAETPVPEQPAPEILEAPQPEQQAEQETPQEIPEETATEEVPAETPLPEPEQQSQQETPQETPTETPLAQEETQPITISSVAPISDITVANGAALDSAGLPAVVTVTLSDATTKDLSVTWDSGNPAYDGNTAGEYIITGVLVLSDDIENPNSSAAVAKIIVQQPAEEESPEKDKKDKDKPEKSEEEQQQQPESLGEVVQDAAASLLNGMWEFIKWVLKFSLSAVSMSVPDNIEKSLASLSSSVVQNTESEFQQLFSQIKLAGKIIISPIRSLFQK